MSKSPEVEEQLSLCVHTTDFFKETDYLKKINENIPQLHK